MISLFSLIFLATCLGMTHGMNCYIGEETFLNSLTKTCPHLGPYGPDSDKSYCCLTPKGEFYCCNFIEFAATYLIIGLVVFIVLSIAFSLICCFCCPCCFCYKRRHRGTVIRVPQQLNVPPSGPQAAAPYNAYSTPYLQQPAFNPSYS